jgi:hypothetical protein
MTDTAVATIAPDATDSEAQSGEVVTPLDRLRSNERIIEKGLRSYETQNAKISETKEAVGQALYEIYTESLWKSLKNPSTGKNLFKNFGEYLEAKGWGKTASRAYQLMAEHRKALKASGETVVERKRGPKAINPGRSAQTFANMIINLRVSMAQRAEAMDASQQAEREFIEIAERFAEVSSDIVTDLEALADRERGRAEAEKETAA